MSTPPPVPTTSTRDYRCGWCGRQCDPTLGSCPGCGAPIDVRKVTTKSGWTKLPAIKDMARIQFGHSMLQVEGAYVPVADFKLAAGDGIYFSHHMLLWKDDQAKIARMPISGWWRRLFAGLPIVLTQATGPGRIAFSRDHAGELIALPLQDGQTLDVREKVFMVATTSVGYDWFNTGIWFQTGTQKEQETHYPVGMFMDRFSPDGSGPGLLLLHGRGNVFVRELDPGQTILIKPTALLFKDSSVQMHLHFEHVRSGYVTWGNWGSRYLWLRLHGPGRVAVQSEYEPLEDPGTNLRSSSPTTTSHRW